MKVDRERERIIRHLDARGVDVLRILESNPTTLELKNLLAGLMKLHDDYGPVTKEFDV